jgi:hypothetical protein
MSTETQAPPQHPLDDLESKFKFNRSRKAAIAHSENNPGTHLEQEEWRDASEVLTLEYVTDAAEVEELDFVLGVNQLTGEDAYAISDDCGVRAFASLEDLYAYIAATCGKLI